MDCAPSLSDANWMGANISQSRMNPSLRGADSSGPGADWTAKMLSSSAPVVIIDFVFITVSFVSCCFSLGHDDTQVLRYSVWQRFMVSRNRFWLGRSAQRAAAESIRSQPGAMNNIDESPSFSR